MAQQVVSSSTSSAQPTGSPIESLGSEHVERSSEVDAVSVLYVLGGIPAILAFLVLLFAVGVRVCGLPA